MLSRLIGRVWHFNSVARALATVFFCAIVLAFFANVGLIRAQEGGANPPTPTALTKTYLSANNCPEFGLVKPYETAVFVSLRPYYIGGSADVNTAIREALYEIKYVRQSVVPFNFVAYRPQNTMENSQNTQGGAASAGLLRAIYCDAYDFTLPQVYKLLTKGGYSLLVWDATQTLNMLKNQHATGVAGAAQNSAEQGNVSNIAALFEKYPIKNVYFAGLALEDQKVVLSEAAECTLGVCKSLTVNNPFLQRPVKIKISVNYEQVLEPLKEYAVKVSVENLSSAPIVPFEYVPLWVKKTAPSGVSPLYNKNWYSVGYPVVLNDKYILPGQVVHKEFKIGPFIKPGTYASRFAIFYDGKKVPNTDFRVNVRVKKGNFKLGYIKGRELDYVNVRAQPSLNAPVKFRLDVGEYVVVNKVDGAWVSITTKFGQTGWVYRPLITILDE